MSTETTTMSETESAKKLRSNTGTFSDGKWYCDCPGSLEAKFYQAGKGTENAGKWFWRCPRSRDAGCKFWLLEEEEELRKSRLVRLGLLDSRAPKTPSPNKRKRGADRADEIQNETEVKEENSPTGTLSAGDNEERLYMATPSRKVAKATILSRPSQKMRETAPEPTTPGSSTQSAVASRFQALDVFSTPTQLQRELNPSEQTLSALSVAIIYLLKSKEIQLDDEIEMRLEHMIGLEIDQHEAVVSRYKKTINELSRRITDWKNIALQE